MADFPRHKKTPHSNYFEQNKNGTNMARRGTSIAKSPTNFGTNQSNLRKLDVSK